MGLAQSFARLDFIEAKAQYSADTAVEIQGIGEIDHIIIAIFDVLFKEQLRLAGARPAFLIVAGLIRIELVFENDVLPAILHCGIAQMGDGIQRRAISGQSPYRVPPSLANRATNLAKPIS
jgi:hypothetical protein